MIFTALCLCVCLSVFPHDISKTDAARITKLQTCYINVPRWGQEAHLFWDQKVTGQGHESQKQSTVVSDVVEKTSTRRLSRIPCVVVEKITTRRREGVGVVVEKIKSTNFQQKFLRFTYSNNWTTYRSFTTISIFRYVITDWLIDWRTIWFGQWTYVLLWDRSTRPKPNAHVQ